jgi:hypothetical protein
MRQAFRVVALILVALIAAPQFALAVQVPVGTQVPVQVMETVSPAQVNMGSIVPITAAGDVTVNGKVVVRQGATGTAEVVRVEKKGAIGKPASLMIEVKSIGAVDGQTIRLSGSKSIEGEDKQTKVLIIGIVLCLPYLLAKGGDAVIASGSVINATVAVNADIK